MAEGMFLNIFPLEENFLLVQTCPNFLAIATLVLKYVCKLENMKLPTFPPFHLRIAQVKVVGRGPKQPSNIDLCSPCWLTSSHTRPFALLCNFQLSMALVMRYSSGSGDAFGLLNSYTSFKRCSLIIRVIYSWAGKTKKSPSFIWNWCFSFLTLNSSTF